MDKKEYQKEYWKRPEVKERQKEYWKRPEVKERQKEYRKRPEVKERQKEYRKRPEVKERRKEYSPCKTFIKKHHEEMQHDPERLTTEFLIDITGCKCERKNDVYDHEEMG